MGLYDYINGEQVKCFYRPIFSVDEGIWHSGGHMTDYLDGDEVPTKTMHYKYPDNFMILDYKKYENSCYIHIIKDKKIFKTCNLNNISNNDFKDNNLVVDYYGTSILKINSTEDINCYIKESRNLNEKIKELNKDAHNTHAIFFKCFRLIQSLDEIEEPSKVLDLISEDNFKLVKSILYKKNITSFLQFKNKKEELLTDIQYLEELKPLFKEAFEKEFHRLNKEHESKKSIAYKLIQPYEEQHINKWYSKDIHALEKEFGEYLDCIIYLFKEKDRDSSILDNMGRYIACKKEFLNFIEKNIGIKERYIKWSELNKEDVQTLENTLNLVLYS